MHRPRAAKWKDPLAPADVSEIHPGGVANSTQPPMMRFGPRERPSLQQPQAAGERDPRSRDPPHLQPQAEAEQQQPWRPSFAPRETTASPDAISRVSRHHASAERSSSAVSDASGVPNAEARKPARAAPYKAPTFRAVEAGSTARAKAGEAPRERSTSPLAPGKLPCVAHAVYTRHANCGCMDHLRLKRSPKASPQRQVASPPSPLKLPASRPREETVAPPRTPSPKRSPRSSLPATPIAAATPAAQPPTKSLFHPPQRIAVVPGHVRGVVPCGVRGDCEHVAFVADRGPGLSLRRALSGEVLRDGLEGAKGGKVQASVVRCIGDEVWVGFQDGSVRIYDSDGSKRRELRGHRGAVTDIVQAGPEVFTCALDCKVCLCHTGPTAPSDAGSATRGSTSVFATLKAPARCMASICGSGSGEATLLACGCDDGNIALLALGAAEPTFAVLRGHPRAVNALLVLEEEGVGPALWSAADDGCICVWGVRERRLRRKVPDLADGRPGVASLQRVGANVWALDRAGKLSIYDADNGDSLHEALLAPPPPAAATAGATPSRTASAALSRQQQQLGTVMFHVAPVEGQVVWTSDAATGTTTSWYCPGPVPVAVLEAPPGSNVRGGAPSADSVEEFERSEREVEAHAMLEQRALGLLRSVDSALAAHGEAMEEHISRCASLLRPPRTENADAAALDATDALVDQLQRQLAECRASAEEAVRERDGAAQRLECDAAAAAAASQAAQEELARLRRQNEALEDELQSMRKAAPEDAGRDETARLDARVRVLEGELAARDAQLARMDSDASDAAAQLRACVENAERRVAQLATEYAARLGERDKQVAQLTKERAELQAAAAAAAAARREGSQGRKDESSSAARAKLAQELRDAQTQVELLQHSTQKLTSELEHERVRVREVEAAAGERRALDEAKVADMRARLDELADGTSKLQQLREENAMLRAQQAHFNTAGMKELMSENADLRKQLAKHQHHVTRLLETDMERARKVKELEEQLEAARQRQLQRHKRHARDRSEAPRSASSPSPDAAARGASPLEPQQCHAWGSPARAGVRGNRSQSPHNPSDPHHRVTCVWCSGRINISAGGTFGVASPNYRYELMRSPSLGPGERSASSPPKLADVRAELQRQAAAAAAAERRSRSAASSAPAAPTISSPAQHQQPLGTAAAAAAAAEDDDAAERRIRVLQEAHRQAMDQQVRAALVEEILTLHRSLPPSKAAAVPLNI